MTGVPADRSVVAISDGGVVLGGRPVLRHLDLRIDRGEAVAILGANGSGKSTLVQALLGLLPLSDGEARLFGVPVADFTLWRRIGYVPQRAGAGSGVPATVREVVASGRLAHRRPFVPLRAADRTAIAEALAATGLAERAGHNVATLSGGQQQRVLVARALAARPDLLVLDEPNAGVDLRSQQSIADTVAERLRRGATVVVVLHELGPFAPLLDRVVVLREGRVAYDGAPGGVDPEGNHHHHGQPADEVRPVPDVHAPLEGDR